MARTTTSREVRIQVLAEAEYRGVVPTGRNNLALDMDHI